ncbi:MAG: hypothetical protein GC154_11575 [bacterium]|nr:hypothetical protein [bacterium]
MTDVQAIQEIMKRVHRAHRRVCAIELWHHFVRWVFYCGLFASIVILGFALSPIELNRGLTAAICLACAPLAALIHFFTRRRDLMSTALMADRRLKLKEKISSAIDFTRQAENDDEIRAWKQAAVMDAWRAVNRLDVKRAFPWTHPGEWHWLWAPALALILTVFVFPQLDLWSGKGEAQADAVTAKQVEKELTAFLNRETVKREVEEKKRAEADQLNKDISELAKELAKGQIDKREALAKVSTLEQKWEQRREEMMKRAPMLNPAADPAMQKFTGGIMKDMQTGDFEKAAEKMASLEKQMKMGDLSPEDQKRLAQELAKMSSMMSMSMPLSKMMKGASEALGSGNQKLSMESLKLAESEMMDLQEMMEQMKLIQGALDEMKDAKLALSGKPGQCKKCGALFKDGKCTNGACSGSNSSLSPFAKTGQWKAGDTSNQGNGMGGPGKGRGGKAPFADTSTGFTPDMLKSDMHDGPIAGIMPADGNGVMTESTIEVGSAAFQYEQASEEALDKERVPVAYRQHVRAYFESLAPAASSESGETDGRE